MANEGTRPPVGEERAATLGGYQSIELFGTAFDPGAPADAIAMRAYRRSRLRTALASHDLAAILLFNPINIRYACDARNMQVYGLHNPCRYVCMTADGHATLFEFRNCEHLSRHLETVDEIRPAKAWYHMAAGANASEAAKSFAREIAALVRDRSGGGSRRVAFDRLDLAGAAALTAEGLQPVDGLELLDFARAIKSADEIKAMCDAIRACEEGMRRMQAAHRPGITEQALVRWHLVARLPVLDERRIFTDHRLSRPFDPGHQCHRHVRTEAKAQFVGRCDGRIEEGAGRGGEGNTHFG